MCGCLIGTLPQVPQQNIFLGLPLELMTEEAALLVEKSAAYIVDDANSHKSGLKAMLEADKQRFLKEREVIMRRHAESHVKAAQEKKAKFLEKKKLATKESTRAGTPTTDTPYCDTNSGEETITEEADEREDSRAHDSGNEDTVAQESFTKYREEKFQEMLGFHVILATSSSPFHVLPSLPITPSNLLPVPPSNSYPVYRYLNQKGYFLSPGLRFGARYLAYPGDPLRFHSHFVVNGLDWDEEINVMDIVGGGRLGTGVKKGWMVGGRNPESEETGGDGVRVFSVEWGGF